jgi:hypothetical protein
MTKKKVKRRSGGGGPSSSSNSYKLKISFSAQSTVLIVAGFVLLYISFISRQVHVVNYNTDKVDIGASSNTVMTGSNINRHHPHNQNLNHPSKPPLSDFVQGWNITNDVNWLLSFSIVAFPKCGTSSLMLYLKNQTNSIYIDDDERCELGWKQEARLVKDLYQHYQPGLMMGIKCPRDLEIVFSRENYRRYFPKTKFIIGLRHPVLWFESFYNHRIQNEFPMPPPGRLIGSCKKSHKSVCTDRANFAKHLSQIEPSRQVFLYDVSQLYDDNDNIKHDNNGVKAVESSTTKDGLVRGDQFRQDLEDFLQLQIPLKGKIAHVRPGRKAMSAEHQQELNSKKITICDPEHEDVRRRLQQHATESATWIESVFLANPNVKVSSLSFFLQILSTWHHDPCKKDDRQLMETNHRRQSNFELTKKHN